MREILWIMPPKSLKNSGIYQYSHLIISGEPNIKTLHLPSNKLRYPFQFLLLPLVLILYSFRFKKVIFAEEGYAFLAPFFLKEKIIIIHDVRGKGEVSTFKEWLKSVYIKINHLGLKYVNKIICVSQFTLDSIKAQGICNLNKTNLGVVYNAIETPHFKEPEAVNAELSSFIAKIKQDPTAIIFLYVGSDETRKNTVELVKALNFSSLESDKKLFLLKVGRPINESNFQAVNEHLHNSSNISGYLNLPEVSGFELDYAYRMSDVFIMPSLFEGFGRTPIEAQNYGLPVISTDAAALKEILGNSCVNILPPYDAFQISKAILNWLSIKEPQTIVLQGYKNSHRFSKINIVNQFKEFLE